MANFLEFSVANFDEEILYFAGQVTLFFFIFRLVCRNVFKCNEKLTVALVCFVHHCVVVWFSWFHNYPYMELLNRGIRGDTTDCAGLGHYERNIYYSGIFCTVYLVFDSVYDIFLPMARGQRGDLLMLFHHLNGVTLIMYALGAKHGLYMVYISHLMEFSSIFLAIKDIIKNVSFETPGVVKMANDAVFAISFVVCRNYVTIASVVMMISFYRNGCWDTFSFVDSLVVYCTFLYCGLTGFWSYGIICKFIREAQALSTGQVDNTPIPGIPEDVKDSSSNKKKN